MSNVEVLQDFYNTVNTFYVHVADCIKCINDLSSFQLKEEFFPNFVSQQMAKENLSWKWWMMNGGEHYALL